jgi:nucleoside-diphosphate-sugar epimerase
LRDTPFVTFEANLQLANAAVAAAQATGVRKIVLASSQSALGLAWAPVLRSPAYLPVDEDHPCAPEETYGASKQATEILFEMAARRDGADVAALRFPTIWDPAEFEQNTWRRLTHPEQGAKSQWAYVDARDAGRSVVLALAAPVRGYRVFNIAADQIFADEDVGSLVRQWYPDRDPAAVDGDAAVFSPARARAELGFVNRYRWTPSGIEDRGV